MSKTILLTGATDGIGLETAKMLVAAGHKVLLHGRNPNKLKDVESALAELNSEADTVSYIADLSRMEDVVALAAAVKQDQTSLDVLINNAGILSTSDPITAEGLDVRFAVNTFAPYLLTQRLLPLMGADGRVVNLSSAAQAPVNLDALLGETELSEDFDAYAQSKFAITMWSRAMALSLGDKAPAIIAVNPGSMLGSKMVKEGFGVAGGDIRIGAEILVRAALDDEFATASGNYFDNDSGKFSLPHGDALDPEKTGGVVQAIEQWLERVK
ncbi:MAG: SDR family NAD(P)-dependent oxidoreductase [Pseudomonadales bacterium]|nr:SDR family NAD(P)-dependent oxidoreductase [Pseudomonadales bacterium]